jgi:hypothetical protein
VVSDAVDVTISALESFKVSLGPRLGEFMNAVPATPTGSFYCREHQSTDDSTQREQFTRVKNGFIDNLIENLHSRFPDNDRLSVVSICDPQRLPVAEDDLVVYGTYELKKLCEHYGSSKTLDSGTVMEPVIDSNCVQDEWIVFKQLMNSNFRPCTLQGMMKKLNQSETLQEQYPNLLTLIALSLTMPVSTVDCERGFSKHNRIKIRTRARLQTSHVTTLMKISIDTPALPQIDQFTFPEPLNSGVV